MRLLAEADLQLSWLVSFLAVIRCGGYEKAAQFLGIRQPTVSKHIDSLEKWMGHDLFRNTRPPKLTESGVQTAKTAQRMLIDLFCLRAVAPELAQAHLMFRADGKVVRKIVFDPLPF